MIREAAGRLAWMFLHAYSRKSSERRQEKQLACVMATEYTANNAIFVVGAYAEISGFF